MKRRSFLRKSLITAVIAVSAPLIVAGNVNRTKDQMIRVSSAWPEGGSPSETSGVSNHFRVKGLNNNTEFDTRIHDDKVNVGDLMVSYSNREHYNWLVIKTY